MLQADAPTAIVPDAARLWVTDAASTASSRGPYSPNLPLAAVIVAVLDRTRFHTPLLWADDVGDLALTVIAIIGGAVAYRRDQRIAVRALAEWLPCLTRAPIHAAADWLVLETAVVCFVTSFPLLTSRWDRLTPLSGMPAHGWPCH